ncbi:fructosamine kinase family protein [Lentilactobacillus sp. Marseille-Q4993]|uniref:fructosamine kinase family protein n=1 Tax=Lentilactobacillus sp. Marseille-Q4993 TaxID=3039492 RepID=UPI0024BBFBA0|nr:fructosamine kinase family protein [Lentilactobacillus sp. Marseille-Q4993]
MDKDWLDQLPVNNITQVTPVGGGDVNNAYRITTTDDTLFLLTQPDREADFYIGEIAGLKEFEKAGIFAPRVLDNGQINGDAYLLITYLEAGRGSQTNLGDLVAKLHKYQSKNGKFGFDYPSIGNDLTFDNSWVDSWSELFVNRRLDLLKNTIVKKGLWQEADVKKYERAREIILATLANHESVPSLLHGDLWGGNYMFTDEGKPALIDPSAFYGDREFDLGVTTVFGGFEPDFYAAYNAAYPLDPGANERIVFYRMYYLMLHLMKFGSMYYSGAMGAINEVIANGNK